jgi:hypothetical protein
MPRFGPLGRDTDAAGSSMHALVAVMSETVDTVGLGHNRPPQPLDATLLLDWLEPELEPLRVRRTALLEALDRFKAGHLPIRDDDEQGNAAEFVKQLRAFVKVAEDLRRTLGQPYLDCTGTLNTAFKRLEADVIAGRELVDDAASAYARARAAEERRHREREAEDRRRAAELAEMHARSSGDDAAWDRAVDTTARAEKAARAAEAGPADLSRVRGDMGAVASLRERWLYELLDINLVPDAYTRRVLDEGALKAAIANGLREVAGLRIFDASRVQVR